MSIAGIRFAGTGLMMQLLLLAGASSAGAQGAFETSAAGIELSADMARSGLNDYWQPSPGFTLFWAMPFHLGEFELRASLLPLKAHAPDVPDINNVLTTLGWGVPVELSRRTGVTAGILIGNNFMYRPAGGPLDGPESEFSAGLQGQVRYRLSRRISLRAGIQRVRVYTFHRMDLSVAGFGAQVHFNTPDRLARFLQ